jgi:tetratricopeptide (TPR) repeat protein
MRSITRYVLACCLAAAVPAISAAQPAGGGKASATAKASVKVSIKADVSAAAQAKAAAGDALYAAGDFEGALVAYGEGFAAKRDTAFIYAMARCHEAAGRADEAKAMFNMYLGASASASLKYKGEAEAALGIGAKAAGGAVGAVGGLAGKVKDTATSTVKAVGSGVYAAVKVSISAQVSAAAKAKAKAADTAYAAGKYEEAAQGYVEVYAQTQQSVALYAAAQAKAQAGDAVAARAMLQGYLVAQAKGSYANDAKALLLALGGNAKASAQAKVSVKAKVSTAAKAKAGAGDAAFKAGKYLDAAKAYGEAAAVDASASALIYARGMAEYHAGNTAAAAATLKTYLAAAGNLEFKAQAEVTLRATGKVSS